MSARAGSIDALVKLLGATDRGNLLVSHMTNAEGVWLVLVMIDDMNTTAIGETLEEAVRKVLDRLARGEGDR